MEREYQRVTNAYMRLLSKLVTESMVPKIRQIAKTELPPNYYRKDDERDFWDRLNEMFEELEKELIRACGAFALHKRISEVASLTVKLSIKDWKRMVKETIGLDLLEDYYNGDFYKRALEEWTRQNVDLIKTIPHQNLSRMREIVLEGYRNGTTTTRIVKAIQKEYGTGRRCHPGEDYQCRCVAIPVFDIDTLDL